MKDDNCNISRWDIHKRSLNNLTPSVFKEAINSKSNIKIIDCRRPDELSKGCIPNSENMNYLSKTLVDEIFALDKEQAHYVYCQSGRRSLRVCILMQNGGFEKVYNLEGGLDEWIKEFGEL